ncbi:MAG: preprotein translocase subunit SecA [Chloroflexi bacterium]|nr:preprotein translocase subunit SecA [Chloroflexota bacterium]MDA1147683.1 preprotein translocase subunit SecA [Chloroflexota bacterium]
MFGAVKKIFGSDSNERALNQLRPLVDLVNEHIAATEALSDDALRAKTDEFRSRLAAGETVDDLMPEGLAVAREAVARGTGERAFDVQILGAIALHRGSIAEMRTGEGKTLVATLALYLNALEQLGAHLVTVNDYLARRDAQWYGRTALMRLGLTIGVLQNQNAFIVQPEETSEQGSFEYLAMANRREVYACDVVYGTNNEFGFDYLRDNMATSLEGRVQKRRHYAIIDEADSVLIDEARTPLIISGPAQDDVRLYPRFARIVPSLTRDVDFTVDERTRSVALTEPGVEKLEGALGIENLYSLENFALTRYMEAALKAEVIYQRDRDYVVKDNEIIIVDAFTGRLMEGRRWSDGLHQAVEAKEGVKVNQESVTYATITIQNFFRLYDKLSGMTGTAVTEAEELSEIYKLEVVVVPTHREIARVDKPDLVFRVKRAKWAAVIEDIVEKNSEGRPVLVGTVAIESSEDLSALLTRRGIEHEVLNAKQHQREAAIIARAGLEGAVTIATNMAGRGTDIKLGEGVAARGGLHVIGTERHESRRIDNQLRGRSGRQGDPGTTRFFVSFEDDLMKRFAPDWLPGMMAKLGLDEETPLESKMVTKAIEQAQQRVEGYNFDTRKHVVEYDDVMNTHRDVIYSERDRVLDGEDLRETVLTMVEDEIDALGASHLTATPPDPTAFFQTLEATLPLQGELTLEAVQAGPADAVIEQALDIAERRYEELEVANTPDLQRLAERLVLVKTIDTLWVSHLTAMDEMRQGIGLRAYGQSDPLVAYKREAHDMYEQLSERIRQTVARNIYHTRVQAAQARHLLGEQTPQQMRTSGPSEPGTEGETAAAESNGSGATSALAIDPNASRADRRRAERQQKKSQKRAPRR